CPCIATPRPPGTRPPPHRCCRPRRWRHSLWSTAASRCCPATARPRPRELGGQRRGDRTNFELLQHEPRPRGVVGTTDTTSEQTCHPTHRGTLPFADCSTLPIH